MHTFLLSKGGWQKFRPKLAIMPNRELKFEFAVVHTQNRQKTHTVYVPFVNAEIVTQKHKYKKNTTNM